MGGDIKTEFGDEQRPAAREILQPPEAGAETRPA